MQNRLRYNGGIHWKEVFDLFRTVVQRVHLPAEARLFMISDLHGHGDGLLQLLDEVRFSRDDVLVIAGDLVEKGPQSLRG